MKNTTIFYKRLADALPLLQSLDLQDRKSRAVVLHFLTFLFPYAGSDFKHWQTSPLAEDIVYYRGSNFNKFFFNKASDAMAVKDGLDPKKVKLVMIKNCEDVELALKSVSKSKSNVIYLDTIDVDDFVLKIGECKRHRSLYISHKVSHEFRSFSRIVRLSSIVLKSGISPKIIPLMAS